MCRAVTGKRRPSPVYNRTEVLAYLTSGSYLTVTMIRQGEAPMLPLANIARSRSVYLVFCCSWSSQAIESQRLSLGLGIDVSSPNGPYWECQALSDNVVEMAGSTMCLSRVAGLLF